MGMVQTIVCKPGGGTANCVAWAELDAAPALCAEARHEQR
jgi:hypothetical protein